MKKTSLFLTVMPIPFIFSGCASHQFDDGLPLLVKSKAYESSRAKFKFFDASEGCPSYNDLPWAKAYLGDVDVTAEGKTKELPRNSPVHVFYFRPNLTPDIMAKGGAKEIRRRSAQIVLTGGTAELSLIEDEQGEMKWVANGAITLEPATSCEGSE